MPLVTIRDIGSVGVITDIAPWDLPPAALTDGMNFRATSGKIQTVGGLKDASGGGFDDVIGHIAQSTDLDKNSLWLLLGAKTIKAFDGNSVISIDLDVDFPKDFLEPELWSTCQVGAMVFMNHPEWFPIYWEDRDAAVEQCEMLQWSPTESWEDKNYTCNVLRSHKNFLFALGMSEDGQVFSDKVRWSHPAEPNGIPYTWATPDEDPSSIAGYVSLGRGGAIVGGESLRDSFVIYSDDAINILDYTGDALGWRRRSVSTSAGLVGKEALVEVKGMHYFISRDDIMMFDGNQIQSLMHNKLRSRLARNINNDARDKSWAAHHATYNEIWFAVPEGDSDYPSVAYVFNYRDGTWALRDLERPMRHGHFGDEGTKFDIRTWNDFGDNLPWDIPRSSWHLAGNAPFSGVIYGADEDKLQNLDPQNPDAAPTSFVSRTDMPIGGMEGVTTITRVYPLIEGTSTVQMRFGSQRRPGDTVRWASDFIDFRPGVDRKIDIRTTGELHAYEVRMKGEGYFNLTGMDMEFSMAGSR